MKKYKFTRVVHVDDYYWGVDFISDFDRDTNARVDVGVDEIVIEQEVKGKD